MDFSQGNHYCDRNAKYYNNNQQGTRLLIELSNLQFTEAPLCYPKNNADFRLNKYVTTYLQFIVLKDLWSTYYKR